MQLIYIICEFAIFHLPCDCTLHCTEKTLHYCTPSSLHTKTTIPKDHYFTYKKETQVLLRKDRKQHLCDNIHDNWSIYIFSWFLFTVLE